MAPVHNLYFGQKGNSQFKKLLSYKGENILEAIDDFIEEFKPDTEDPIPNPFVSQKSD